MSLEDAQATTAQTLPFLHKKEGPLVFLFDGFPMRCRFLSCLRSSETGLPPTILQRLPKDIEHRHLALAYSVKPAPRSDTRWIRRPTRSGFLTVSLARSLPHEYSTAESPPPTRELCILAWLTIPVILPSTSRASSAPLLSALLSPSFVLAP
jgi:hypothetical protein